MIGRRRVWPEPSAARWLAAPGLVALIAGLVAPVEAAEPGRYQLDVQLAPERRHVSVTGRVQVASTTCSGPLCASPSGAE